jgi:hypothetical protein
VSFFSHADLFGSPFKIVKVSTHHKLNLFKIKKKKKTLKCSYLLHICNTENLDTVCALQVIIQQLFVIIGERGGGVEHCDQQRVCTIWSIAVQLRRAQHHDQWTSVVTLYCTWSSKSIVKVSEFFCVSFRGLFAQEKILVI